MENNEFEKYIKKDDAFDTRKLLEGVDLSDVEEEIDLEEILAEYGRHSRTRRCRRATRCGSMKAMCPSLCMHRSTGRRNRNAAAGRRAGAAAAAGTGAVGGMGSGAPGAV